jgi:hypothetical protein
MIKQNVSTKECRWGDLNPQALIGRWILSPVRLQFRHIGPLKKARRGRVELPSSGHEPDKLPITPPPDFLLTTKEASGGLEPPTVWLTANRSTN